MQMKQFLHTKFGIAIILVFLALILGIGAVVVMNLQTEDFRSIQVFKAEGDVTLTRKDQVLAAYKGMRLANGDIIFQPEEGNSQLLLDDNKYVVLEPRTTIQLHAKGKEPDTKTTIHLTEGSIINQLRAPLSGNSTYEVTTPVGTMMVRGTTYRVTVIKNTDGSYSVMLEVFSGSVGVRLILPDQTVSEEVMIEAGRAAEIYGNQVVTEFVFANRNIEYDTLPSFVIEQLISWIKEGVLTMEEGRLEALEQLLLPKESVQIPSHSARPAPSVHPAPSARPAPLAPPALPAPEQQPETPDPQSQEPNQTLPNAPDPVPPPKPEPSPALVRDATPSPGSDAKPPSPPAPSPAYHMVTFQTGSDHEPGEAFSVQQVRDGNVAVVPLLSPSSCFTWYATGSTTPFTFDTPIHADLTLYNRLP